VMRRAKVLTATDTRELDALLIARAGAGRGASGVAQRWMRARYVGQGHELEIPFAPGEEGSVLAVRFGAEHERRMGFVLEQEIEVIGARVAITGDARNPSLVSTRESAEVVRGPAVVALPDATMLVAAGWTARALPIGGYLVERDA
jgi:N-methylhydantoinase A